MIVRMSRFLVVFILSVAFVFMAQGFAMAADTALTDDQAYDRAYTVCAQQQQVLPMQSAGTGAPEQLKTITECMRSKGVPVAYDPDRWIVRTGKNFGQNVHISVDGLFPEGVADLKEMSRKNGSVKNLSRQVPQSEQPDYYHHPEKYLGDPENPTPHPEDKTGVTYSKERARQVLQRDRKMQKRSSRTRVLPQGTSSEKDKERESSAVAPVYDDGNSDRGNRNGRPSPIFLSR